MNGSGLAKSLKTPNGGLRKVTEMDTILRMGFRPLGAGSPILVFGQVPA